MAVAETTCLRGLFDKDDDNVHPLVDNSIFRACPAGMRFETKEVSAALVRAVYLSCYEYLLCSLEAVSAISYPPPRARYEYSAAVYPKADVAHPL